MGGINKHPSCSITWQRTTACSQAISLAFSALFAANASLEAVILAEFSGDTDTGSAEHMLRLISESKHHVRDAQDHLVASIKIGEDTGSPYQSDFRALKPHLISAMWDGKLLVGCKDDVLRIATEISTSHLGPARRFVDNLTELERLTGALEISFGEAIEYARNGRLRDALERNAIPLQANMALALSHWLQFMREYLVDSLIATHVAFTVHKHPALVA